MGPPSAPGGRAEKSRLEALDLRPAPTSDPGFGDLALAVRSFVEFQPLPEGVSVDAVFELAQAAYAALPAEDQRYISRALSAASCACQPVTTIFSSASNVDGPTSATPALAP